MARAKCPRVEMAECAAEATMECTAVVTSFSVGRMWTLLAGARWSAVREWGGTMGVKDCALWRKVRRKRRLMMVEDDMLGGCVNCDWAAWC